VRGPSRPFWRLANVPVVVRRSLQTGYMGHEHKIGELKVLSGQTEKNLCALPLLFQKCKRAQVNSEANPDYPD
jgi:hypothetical protein